MANTKKPIALELTGKIKTINDLLFKSMYCYRGNPTKSIKLLKEAHEIFREIKSFYVTYEENKKIHEEKNLQS